MEKHLTLGTSNLSKSEKQEIIRRVDEGLDVLGEPKGYEWWWEVKTMSNKSYKISEAMKEAMVKSEARFFTMPQGQVIAAHQITEIVKEFKDFGARPGGA